MDISYSNLNRLAHWGAFQFLYHVLNFAESHEEGMPELYTNKLAELRTAFDVFDEAFVQEQRSSPEGLLKAEEDRDYAVRKIYNIVKEYSDFRFDSDKEGAGKVLLKVFKLYGTGSQITKMEQEKETALLINFLQEFQKQANQEAVETLGLLNALDSLQSYNNIFIETHEDRIKDKGSFVAGAVKTSREDAQNVFMEFVDVVNALSIVEGPEKYAELKQTINALLKDYVARSKQRSKKSEEEKPEEVIQ